jgi:hypothetical protein
MHSALCFNIPHSEFRIPHSSKSHEFSRYILHYLVGAGKNGQNLGIAPGPDNPAFLQGAEITA